MSKTFNLTKIAAWPTGKHKRRIRDRGIKWEETYKERSKALKKRFDKQLPGAYRRWEGHDYTTNADYFVVVGPARTKELKKQFFSGIKKYPELEKKVYAPSGEYFNNLSSALSHARKMWAVPFPQGQQNYTVNDLAQIEIPRHVRG